MTAPRAETRTTREAQPLSIVDRRTLELIGARDPSDALRSQPGVFVRQYGGAGGMRTVALRGGSADAVPVTVDGVRYTGTSTGALDFSTLPAAWSERIELARGGSTATAGANATGGVINLQTVRRDTAGSVQGRLTAGSFGERALDLGVATVRDGHTLRLDATHSRVAGDYPFLIDEFGVEREVQRENADLTLTSMAGGWRWNAGGGTLLSATVIGFDADRGVPGAVVQGSIEQTRARLEERDLFAVVRVAVAPDPLGWDLALSARGNSTHYRDPDARAAGADGADESFGRLDMAMSARARWLAAETFLVDGVLELRRESLQGPSLDPELGDRAERFNAGIALAGRWSDADSADAWERSIDVAARLDLFNTLPAGLAPSLGGVLRIDRSPVRLRARVASGYRAPSFAEQYYLNVGNARLRPERSVTLDGGVTVELWESVGVECTAHLTDAVDRIVAVPRSPVSWSAVNIGRTRTVGVELAASGRLFDDRLGVRGSYTRSDARDGTPGPTEGTLLPYAPEESAGLTLDARGAEWQGGMLSLVAVGLYTSHRYALPGEDRATLIPRSFTLDLAAECRQQIGPLALTGRVECANVGDERYQIVRNYPMPGRSWRVSVGVRY